MPIPITRDERAMIIGRLLSEWYRSGYSVPEGFEGTLVQYAGFIADEALNEGEEIFPTVPNEPS